MGPSGGAYVGAAGGADSTKMPNLVSAGLYTLPVCTKHIMHHASLLYLGNHYRSCITTFTAKGH